MFTLKRLTLNCCLKPCNGFVLLSLKFMIGQIWTSFNSNNNGLKHIPFYFLPKNKKNTDIIPPKVQNKSKIESASAPKNTADKHRKKEGRKTTCGTSFVSDLSASFSDVPWLNFMLAFSRPFLLPPPHSVASHRWRLMSYLFEGALAAGAAGAGVIAPK